MRLNLVDASAAIELVTIDEAKLQLKLPVGVPHAEDSLIEDILIPAARERAETATNRQLRQVTWELALDAGDWVASGDWLSLDAIEIPKAPLVEVLSVTYVDVNGVTQTFATSQYVVDAPSGPKARRGRVALAYSAVWPWTRTQINALTIQFVAGYSSLPLPTYGPTVPPLLKVAMLLDIATLYAIKENVITGTIVAEVPSTSKEIYRSFRSWNTARVAA